MDILPSGNLSTEAGQLHCCGEDRPAETVAALLCHEDIKVCRTCLGWLLQQAGGVEVTPRLPVSAMDEATRFYATAGFDVRRYDDGFAFVSLRDQSVFDLDLIPTTDPATNGAGCYVIIDEVDPWHRRLADAGLPVTPVEEQPWQMREFTLTDPSGNRIRIGRPTS